MPKAYAIYFCLHSSIFHFQNRTKEILPQRYYNTEGEVRRGSNVIYDCLGNLAT